jgi:hypothetical protein
MEGRLAKPRQFLPHLPLQIRPERHNRARLLAEDTDHLFRLASLAPVTTATFSLGLRAPDRRIAVGGAGVPHRQDEM